MFVSAATPVAGGAGRRSPRAGPRRRPRPGPPPPPRLVLWMAEPVTPDDSAALSDGARDPNRRALIILGASWAALLLFFVAAAPPGRRQRERHAGAAPAGDHRHADHPADQRRPRPRRRSRLAARTPSSRRPAPPWTGAAGGGAAREAPARPHWAPGAGTGGTGSPGGGDRNDHPRTDGWRRAARAPSRARASAPRSSTSTSWRAPRSPTCARERHRLHAAGAGRGVRGQLQGRPRRVERAGASCSVTSAFASAKAKRS